MDESYISLCGQIGSLLTIDTQETIVLGLIASMKTSTVTHTDTVTNKRLLEIELVGELVRESDGYLRAFRRGVTVYPKLGDPVWPATRSVLEKAYRIGDADVAEIGRIHQDPSIPAVVRLDELFGKHFAIVGSTGTGKSCTTALILRKVIEKHPDAHILLFDPHGEYATCFGDASQLIRPQELDLPIWFMNFEETIEILIGGSHKNSQEVEILRDLIPIAKRQFANNKDGSTVAVHRAGLRNQRYSVDVPIPYRISDVIALIDTQMGRLEQKNDLAPLRRLKARIESIHRDPRYGFMFGRLAVEDTLANELRRIFRFPSDGKPITVLQLTGIPSEIVNVLLSVLARLAFDISLSSEGAMPITIICEEAHRYVPSDSSVGFEPTKRAIARIAKEGRKYGVSIGIVTQRTGDIDPTILSQCSTIFAMRLSNDHDQQIVGSALSDSSRSLLEFLPTLGTREAIVFGEGVTLPSRVRLELLPHDALPAGRAVDLSAAAASAHVNSIENIVERWRMSAQPADSGTTVASPPQDQISERAIPREVSRTEIPGSQPGSDPQPVNSPSLNALAARLQKLSR